MMRVRATLYSILLLSVLLVGGFYYFLTSPLQRANQSYTFYFAPKSSVGALIESFKQDGLIAPWQKPLLQIYVRLLSMQGKTFKAGEYAIQGHMSPMQVFARLQKGEVVMHSITLIEGETFQQALERIWRHASIKRTWFVSDEPQIAKALGLTTDSMEGQICPETYYFTFNTTDKEIVQRAYQLMQKRLHAIWQTRDNNLALKSPYEALIMASIIEKESAHQQERYRISGVFAQRLNKHMRLQADPTVLYGVKKQITEQCQNGQFASIQNPLDLMPTLKASTCEQLKQQYWGAHARLTKQDLQQDQAYNSYTRHGLPPTPITLPSMSALHAACHPENHSYLYFVAKPDGSHHFSSTLEDHNQAVRFYIKGIGQYGNIEG